MPPPGGNGGVEMGGSSLDEPLTEFEVRSNKIEMIRRNKSN